MNAAPFAVDVEHRGDRRAGEGEGRPGEERVADRQRQRVGHRAPHPVHQPRAEVLAEDRPDRAGQREHDAEGERDDAVDHRAAGDRRDAEVRPDAGDVERGDRHGEIGEDRRHADAHDRREIATDRLAARGRPTRSWTRIAP